MQIQTMPGKFQVTQWSRDWNGNVLLRKLRVRHWHQFASEISPHLEKSLGRPRPLLHSFSQQTFTNSGMVGGTAAAGASSLTGECREDQRRDGSKPSSPANTHHVSSHHTDARRPSGHLTITPPLFKLMQVLIRNKSFTWASQRVFTCWSSLLSSLEPPKHSPHRPPSGLTTRTGGKNLRRAAGGHGRAGAGRAGGWSQPGHGSACPHGCGAWWLTDAQCRHLCSPLPSARSPWLLWRIPGTNALQPQPHLGQQLPASWAPRNSHCPSRHSQVLSTSSWSDLLLKETLAQKHLWRWDGSTPRENRDHVS